MLIYIVSRLSTIATWKHPNPRPPQTVVAEMVVAVSCGPRTTSHATHTDFSCSETFMVKVEPDPEKWWLTGIRCRKITGCASPVQLFLESHSGTDGWNWATTSSKASSQTRCLMMAWSLQIFRVDLGGANGMTSWCRMTWHDIPIWHGRSNKKHGVFFGRVPFQTKA